MDYPKIAIVIPVFNRINHTVQCLESLKNVRYPNLEIIIIDDGSTDRTSEVIKKYFPYVVLVEGDGNLWWAKATNLGIKKAVSNKAQYILFLNNDDEVDNNIVLNLLQCAKDNPDSIIGCKVRHFEQPNKIIFAGGFCDWENRGLFRHGDGEIDLGQHDMRKEIEWIPGAGTFVNVDVFEKIGLIDDGSFPQYRGDIDFTLRAHKAGYRVIFEPTAVLYKKMEPNTSSCAKRPEIFRKLIMPLFSRRSPMNLKTESIFVWKHCPKKYMIRRFFWTYYSYYKGFFSLNVIKRHYLSKR